MKNTILIVLLISLFGWSSCEETPQCPEPATSENANLDQFLGLWYEIASIPQIFTTGCKCTTAEYSLSPDGNGVTVSNTCQVLGFTNNIQGIATQASPDDFSKLLVNFPSVPGPAGDYWILHFAADASYMLVGGPDRDQLYILSRTPVLGPNKYNGLLGLAEELCFDISQVELTEQSCF